MNSRRCPPILPALLALASLSPAAQEAVIQPPTEIRSLVQAFVAGANGTANEWLEMVESRFDQAFLKRHNAAERRAIYEKLRSGFGTFALGRVTREGPDAPLVLEVKGRNANGTITLDIVEAPGPRVSKIGIRIGEPAGKRVGGGPPPPPIDGRMPAEALAPALDAYLMRLTAEDAFSGVALVAKEGKPVFQKAYGYADRANKRMNTIGTRFNIGSINKTFTQIAIRQLAAQGKLGYDDTLGKFFPDYPQEVSRSATIRQLMEHTAGLADFFGPEFSQASKDRFLSNADYFGLVGSRQPLFAPGTDNRYCNGCYIALGAIVERVSGMPYERYVEANVFRRADMSATGYPRTDAIEPDVALGYTRRGRDEELRSNVFLHGAAGSAAGGGYSTVGDLFAFVNAARAGRFPGVESGMGIAGGAPGVSAGVESNGTWTVIVLSNLDPPTGERIGMAIIEALTSGT